MSNIKNYTSQTNSHKGYTIEELRRLLGEGITVENITKLINECFNYELVSGKGIRLIELKNNDFRNNTTKTYKIECTCEGGEAEGVSYDNTQSGMHSDTVQDAIDELDRRVDILENGSGSGSGGGWCDVDADQGVTFGDGEIAPRNTIIADLYDYEWSGDPDTDGIYPVSLSEDGKLIVDMTTSNITVTASSANNVHIFENTDIRNNFTFNIHIEGSKLEVQRIETWITEKVGSKSETEMSETRQVYTLEDEVIQNLNANKSCTLKRDCSARIDLTDVNSSIVRKGKILVTYKIKNGADTTKNAVAQTKFLHQVYYGYTCEYFTDDHQYVSPKRDFDETSQPCFKVYSHNLSDYDDNRRTGLVLTKSNNDYDLIITNTEPPVTQYVLGYYDTTSAQQGKHTLKYLPSSASFNLTGFGSHGYLTVYYVILIPSSMGGFTSLDYLIDESTSPYSLMDSVLEEKVLIQDKTYYSDDRFLEIEYIAYTPITGFQTTVENDMKLQCTVSKF